MKKYIIISTLIIVFLLGFILILNSHIKSYGSRTCDKQNETKQVALVLGAKVYQNGRMSDIFKDRVDSAIQLYKGKKVEKILISGDHGTAEYDEVNTAKEYLLERGIEAQNIFLDHAGFDTYDSVFRAKEIFDARSVIIVTQNFHLPRALYIAEKLELDSCGQSADIRTYVGEERREAREILARVKAWFNVVFNSKPKFLGDKIPLSGDGQQSWD